MRGLSDKIDNRFLWLLAVFGAGFLVLASGMVASYLRLADAIAALPH